MKNKSPKDVNRWVTTGASIKVTKPAKQPKKTVKRGK